jgi:Domain of unknown function (DUF1905)/Bacteriocin-protection, YdeI or OmpD-Associated
VRFQVALRADPSGPGTYVAVPEDVAAALGLKGRPKVHAVIAGHPYRGSLMPLGDGTFVLGVLKAIQEAEGLKRGDTITVELEIDTAPRAIEPPADLARALARDREAKAAWAKLSYTNQREMARSVEDAKRPETRERRLAAALNKLRGFDS